APRPPELPTLPVSPYDVAAGAVANAACRLADEQSFDVLAFNDGSKAFAGKFVNATAKETGSARDWLRGGAPAPVEARDVASALRAAVERDPDEVFLVLAGGPAPPGKAEPAAAAVLAAAAAAWRRGIPVNVVLLEPEPAAAPRDEREKLER